jgi:alpha-N-arabinofuranosidase
MLDAVGTLSEDRKTMYVSVVNRAEDVDVETTLNIKGWKSNSGAAHVFELNGKDKVAANPFGSAASVNIHERSINVSGSRLSYKFPAHSVTVIEMTGGA